MKFLKTTLLSLLLLSVLLPSCDLLKEDPDDGGGDGSEINNLGWFGSDDMNTVPSNVSYFGNGGNLPSSVDLTAKFPPIGDQGQYGTCVAWAVAYNYKTAINGMEKGYNSSQLSSSAYQSSPKDLFLAIPNNLKGPNCGGTDFGAAFDVVQQRGVASAQSVPYTGLGDCSSGNSQSNWANEANQNRIKYWRKVQASSAADLKALIADNIPVVFGAKLADNFMSWNSNAVLSSSSSFANVGQHAYHAMVIAGYDDGKSAFKVINSWSPNWGANGYIWVDYDYFMGEFCRNSLGDMPLFIAVNENGSAPPDDPDPVSTGVDLAAWVFNDYANGYYQGYPKRVSQLNAYNIGNATANANNGWSIYYLAFNAYDADDFGVLFSCDVNTSVAYGTEYCTDFNTCTYNVNIPSGSNFGYELLGANTFDFAYTMPFITGEYYLVVYVDPFDAFTETDETNNIFYPFYDPVYFVNGEGLMGSNGASDRSASLNFQNTMEASKENLKANRHNSLVYSHPNAYTNQELNTVIRRAKQDGRWEKKVKEMLSRNPKR